MLKFIIFMLSLLNPKINQLIKNFFEDFLQLYKKIFSGLI